MLSAEERSWLHVDVVINATGSGSKTDHVARGENALGRVGHKVGRGGGRRHVGVVVMLMKVMMWMMMMMMMASTIDTGTCGRTSMSDQRASPTASPPVASAAIGHRWGRATLAVRVEVAAVARHHHDGEHGEQADEQTREYDAHGQVVPVHEVAGHR